MASKLKLQPHPTFKCKVDIPVPGAGVVEAVFEFKHKGLNELERFWADNVDNPDPKVAEALVVGWELEDEFTTDNLRTLLDNYPGAARALISAYSEELITARRGN
ncbi:hypothetical protein A7P96_00610 [Eikenella sp. NML03-A-027]|uniref:Phage tail assembly chaperone n=1 Tax=Eikenella exigua TaxID=2528037 RepID=A0AAX1FA43_9NEIS|nr:MULTISPECIES: phage tail assembly chaperone [Eikenella]OAM26211.1 hypothetical protein A7P94_07845 [Eikenella sp. NML01-A-086]OAM33245.1 hypothetical protein A7P96_00610 [Eikenella sp. NML03-A-027]OAM45082.1 hypothetical protein A7Q03_06085 [Eikenella sp. NML99-0057]QED92850.1 hypothetical protein EZJ17_09715 [Eikenella exigua]